MKKNCTIGYAAQTRFPRYPKRDWRECIMQPPSGFRVGASFCRPTSGYIHVAEAAVDSLCLGVHGLLAFSSRVCPKFRGPHLGFSCLGFLSLVERRELCRYTSGSAGVAKLAPCPICLPSSPARYALGVGERCAQW